ncbi:unnamed protein product [Gulo gulo]|uniref:Uncharacterized protein n=1 Tax=Gulo gulo TaxID=48420 RepID=A0A9X9LFB7_GULGU|nr:unnamed protein product [Gulo gulo]
MSCLVYKKVRLLTEGFPTFTAFKWLLSSMNSLMYNEM